MIHRHHLMRVSCGSTRTSRTCGYMPELERSTPAKAWGVVEAEVVSITHPACQDKNNAPMGH